MFERPNIFSACADSKNVNFGGLADENFFRSVWYIFWEIQLPQKKSIAQSFKNSRLLSYFSKIATHFFQPTL